MSLDQYRLTEQTRNNLVELIKGHQILYNEADRSPEAKVERTRLWNLIGQQVNLSGKY